MPARKSKNSAPKMKMPKPSMELEGHHMRHVSGVKPGGRVRFEVDAKVSRKVESTSRDPWDRSSAKLEIQSIKPAKSGSRFAKPVPAKPKAPRKSLSREH